MALLAGITTGCNTILIKEYINKIKYIIEPDKYLEYSEKYNENLYVIYVNGTIMGITLESKKIMEEIENFKNCGIFNEQVSYFINDLEKEIRIFCDSGRYIRPVFTIERKFTESLLSLKIQPENIQLSWRELVDQGYIKYIDSNEVEHSVIAMNISDLQQYPENPYKYCEIHPSAMLGVCSAVIPYSNHIQNPRLVYQSSMVKQALGVYALSYKNRFDTVAHVLHYPQKPLVGTRYDKMLKYDEMLTGCNPIVAIACYGSYNVEDSLIWNKSSVDRGMFVHTCYKTITCEENKKTNNSIEIIEIPPEKLRTNGADYSKLGPTGVVVKGAHVYKGDIIVGKTITKSKKEDEDISEYSVAVGTGEEGIVDEVWDGYNEDGERMVKIKIRQLRIPEVGDKSSSRSSQKGVCGIMLPQEDMPYTSQGIVPDLIMNPHSQPSRMSISQLLECLSGKVASLSGNFIDSTTFCKSSTNPVEIIANELQKHGFQKYGNERMYSGYTGEILEASIFIGPTYYQRLKHLVKDKWHSRARGNTTLMHLQPNEGRANGMILLYFCVFIH